MRIYKLTYKKAKRILAMTIIMACIGLAITPCTQFDSSYSNIIYDKDGQLLGAKIAEDGQWRFPLIDSIPNNYEQALLTFEDKRFYKHIGIDFLSLSRAIKQNLKERRIVSGASTLTMQLSRMSRGNQPRTIMQKLIEIAVAIKTELYMSKSDILRHYASHAPMGGNVVGIEAASWRYFSKSPHELSISEAATLAVLPNAPTLIHPGKNRIALKNKRDRLLRKLYEKGHIDSLNYELSLLESIPEKPKPLPQLAPHLLAFTTLKNENKQYIKNTSIDRNIHKAALHTAKLYALQNQQNDIQNLGIIVLDTKSGNVLAYVGNSPVATQEKDVDMIQASRSSGSVLKPLLYAHALDDGLILPSCLVEDIPTQYNGYKPKNYNRKHLGAVRMDEALSKSLNIPAVELLRKYNVTKFLGDLKSHGFSTFNRSADNYGLSLILGGGEISLWELAGAYASMGRTMMHYKSNQSRYNLHDYHAPTIHQKSQLVKHSFEPPVLSAGAIHHTLSAMKKLSRPNEEGDWEAFNSAQKISWKTGTSYGHRDAWAIGVSPQYTVGVWVGNADGEGRHELVGVEKAAPILFDIFNNLPQVSQFEIPYDDLVESKICSHTGFLAGPNCAETDENFIIATDKALLCPYHVKVSIDEKGQMVNSKCHPISESSQKSYLVLPPSMAYYYRQNHPEYKLLPPIREDCLSEHTQGIISFIYPSDQTKIYLPIDRNGEKEKAIFKVAHQDPQTKLYWHLDNRFLGTTTENHVMDISANSGKHQVVVVDKEGNSVMQKFEILSL